MSNGRILSFRAIRRATLWLALAGALVASVASGQVESSAANPSGRRVLRALGEIWGIPAGEQQDWHPIDAEAEILYFDPDWRLLWVYSAGVANYVKLGANLPTLKSGQRVRLVGEVRPSEGLSADRLRVEILEVSPEREVHAINLATDELSPFESKLVRFEGYVQKQVEIDPTHVLLEVIANGRLVNNRVMIKERAPIPQWEGMMVSVTALFAPKKDPLGRVTTIDGWVADVSDVVARYALSEHPGFQGSAAPIEQIPKHAEDQSIRVTGILHSKRPGEGLLLRDDTGQVLLKTEQLTSFEPGDELQATGFPGFEDLKPILREALVTKLNQPTGAGASEGVMSKLRLASQVLELSQAEAARGHPVQLFGVVLWSDPRSHFYFVSDGSAGVRVQPKRDLPPPAPGASVEITGVSAAGPFAPVINATTATPLGSLALPAPRRITLEQALTGVEEGQWVELRGYVREARLDGFWCRLQITTSAGEFSAVLPPGSAIDRLRGAIVALRGVCSAVPNERRQLIGVELRVPSLDYVDVEEPVPDDPYSLRPQSIASLREYSTLENANRRVRLSGIVLHHSPGRYFFLQEGTEGLLVLSRETDFLSPGDRVDVVGFAGRESSRVVLREAIYRKISSGPQPAATPLAVGPRTVNEDLDSRLVRVNAAVIDATHRPGEWTLLLQAGTTAFEARMDLERPEDAPALSPGSRVSLTGVYRTGYDEYRSANSFHVQLRTAEDVVVLREPSWWTAERALGVAGVCALAAFLGMGWVTLLRRRVRQQTSQIRSQVEKESNLEARYRDIVENASDFIFSLDAAGRFTSFNPAGERIFGYTLEQALRLNIRELLAPEEDEAVLPFLAQHASAGSTEATQARFVTSDRRVIWIEINARRTMDTNGAKLVLGVGRDITERKQIEEELKRARDAAEATTRAKSAFLANMSHEIRTPMNGVIGMSNLLMDTPLNETQRDFAETIRNSADALLTVLNDILDFSKIEAGKLHFETLDFNLRETVDETIELLAARAAGKGLDLAAFVPMNVPCYLRGDSSRLRQVLLNLIGNAVKFTEKGEVVVSVKFESKSERDVHLCFEVTDTGIGMSAEALARLFKPFSQADNSTTRRFGGTGLGLAISKQIIELMGGSIGVRSTLGEGSTFWFTLRLDRQPDRPSMSPLAPAEALRGRRTLIVDDSATNRRIMEHYLHGWGLVCEQVPNGPAALERLRAAAKAKMPFHIVVLDFEMPNMDGRMLAREIHADPLIAGARMVMCTSWDNQVDRTELQTLGVAHVMLKPIRQPELLKGLLHAAADLGPTGTTAAPFAAAPARDPSFPPLAQRTAAAQWRLLVAEDNAVNQRVTLLQLQKLGYRADIAATGTEVLEALERGRYDAVLMDCHMPEMDGYEATRRIRQNPRLAPIKIIAMTANVMQGDRERCLASGMDDYVSKPTRLNDLQDALVRNIG